MEAGETSKRVIHAKGGGTGERWKRMGTCERKKGRKKERERGDGEEEEEEEDEGRKREWRCRPSVTMQ